MLYRTRIKYITFVHIILIIMYLRRYVYIYTLEDKYLRTNEGILDFNQVGRTLIYIYIISDNLFIWYRFII